MAFFSETGSISRSGTPVLTIDSLAIGTDAACVCADGKTSAPKFIPGSIQRSDADVNTEQ